jgi:hypothetical protein
MGQTANWALRAQLLLPLQHTKSSNHTPIAVFKPTKWPPNGPQMAPKYSPIPPKYPQNLFFRIPNPQKFLTFEFGPCGPSQRLSVRRAQCVTGGGGGGSVGAPPSWSPQCPGDIPMAGREGPGRGRPASGRCCRVHTVPLGLPKAQDSMVRRWAPHNLATIRCALRVRSGPPSRRRIKANLKRLLSEQARQHCQDR